MNCPHCNIPAECRASKATPQLVMIRLRKYRCDECGWRLNTQEIETTLADRWRWDSKQLRKVRAAVGG